MRYYLILLTIYIFSCKSTPENQSQTSINFEENKQFQDFIIKVNASNTIYGKEGIILKIPKDSFEDLNGNEPEGDNVTIKIKEVFSKMK